MTETLVFSGSESAVLITNFTAPCRFGLLRTLSSPPSNLNVNYVNYVNCFLSFVYFSFCMWSRPTEAFSRRPWPFPASSQPQVVRMIRVLRVVRIARVIRVLKAPPVASKLTFRRRERGNRRHRIGAQGLEPARKAVKICENR